MPFQSCLDERERPYTVGEPEPLGRRQVVRQRTLDPPYVGSNPTAPAIAIDARGPNRQVIELEGSRLARASPSGGEAFQRLPSARRKRGILLLVTGRGWVVGGARLPAQARGDGDEAESGTGFLRAKGRDD